LRIGINVIQVEWAPEEGKHFKEKAYSTSSGRNQNPKHTRLGPKDRARDCLNSLGGMFQTEGFRSSKSIRPPHID
jgi:hypothetical protein